MDISASRFNILLSLVVVVVVVVVATGGRPMFSTELNDAGKKLLLLWSFSRAVATSLSSGGKKFSSHSSLSPYLKLY